jgi:hypothetical protein
VEDVGRDHAERDAVDALAREIEVVDELGEGGARMDEQARHARPVQGVEAEGRGDDGKRPAHRAARCLEQEQDQASAQHHVRRGRVADPEGEIVQRDQWHVQDGHHRHDGEKPIVERDA